MKRLSLDFIFAAVWLAAVTLLADNAEQLSGKWSVQKTNDQGQTFKQTVEIKGNKFVFEIAGADGQAVLHAEGDMKLEKLGPFNSVRFSHIRAGSSSADLQEVDDEFTSIYWLDSDTWTMASNFDKERQGRKPSVDNYHRVKAAAQGGTLVIDEIEMANTPQSATWFICFEAKIEGVTRRYYIKDKGYDKNKVTIPMALEVPNVRAGQKCSFKMQLDDIDEDACSEEMDNRSTGEFAVSDRGSQSYKPEENWRYTLRWHLK